MVKLENLMVFEYNLRVGKLRFFSFQQTLLLLAYLNPKYKLMHSMHELLIKPTLYLHIL